MRKPSARTGAAVVLTAAAAAAVTSLGTTQALATPKPHSHSGDNGTVKVHRSTTRVDDPRNEPHVCGFYLDGFGFDARQQVSWRIVSWPPTGDRTQVLHGTLTLGMDGDGHTSVLSLPNGHYKLYWNFAGENGKAKHKVFWVKCGKHAPEPSPTPSTGTLPTSAPSPAGPTTQPQAPAPAPTPTPVPTDLPVTG